MTKAEILQLGELSRIALSDAEAEKLHDEIDSILAYVGTINDIVADSELTKTVGARFNIFREDVVTNEPGAYTKDLVQEMPATEGNYLKVKKILSND
jgi:aspartyl/glutamyl-tRNA(Asn/Gln) amidotransferase C subunit